jgi:hypothetical protein
VILCLSCEAVYCLFNFPVCRFLNQLWSIIFFSSKYLQCFLNVLQRRKFLLHVSGLRNEINVLSSESSLQSIVGLPITLDTVGTQFYGNFKHVPSHILWRQTYNRTDFINNSH